MNKKNKINPNESTVLAPLDNLAESVSQIIIVAQSITVADEVEAETASDYARILFDCEKGIDKLRVQAVKPYNDEVKRINGHARNLIDNISDSKKKCNLAVATWQAAERKRIEAINEARRIEAETETRKIAEANRLAIEESERQAQVIIDKAEAEAELFGGVVESLPDLPAPVILAAPPQPARTAEPITFVSTRKDWEVTITDMNVIPRYLLNELAERYADQLIVIIKREKNNGRDVPGAQFVQVDKPISRGFRK